MTLNLTHDTALPAQLRAFQTVIGPSTSSNPISSVVTTLMRHGGLYTLLDNDVMSARLLGMIEAARATGALDDDSGLARRLSASDVAGFLMSLQGKMANFFGHLVDAEPCPTPVSLMSYLTFPHEGTTYSEGAQESAHPEQFESPDVPAPFTFVGQFVDHDLTMNAVNLVDLQTGVVVDGASPLIDLDSVYGPRSALASPPQDIFEGDRFRLTDTDGVIDLPRNPPNPADGSRHAIISDARNDENQLVLQVHLLIERLHNAFVDQGCDFAEARRRTLLNWQAVLLTDYLPRILQPAVLADVLSNLECEPFGNLKHKPSKNLATGAYEVTMPHEFAIGFRMGHSQLRRAYKLNGGAPVRLFDGSLGTADLLPAGFDDLRGSQDLVAAHQIDWEVFLTGEDPTKSNAIDSHVTSVVFDLPESAIPDDIKFIGNLTHRNLIRSRQVGLCAGEDLAALYGYPPLTPIDIEPDTTKHHLFSEGGTFRTPLWYYLLKEAEHFAPSGENAARLGPAGSRLIAEVVAGGVRYAPNNPWLDTDLETWSIGSDAADPGHVELADIVAFVGA